MFGNKRVFRSCELPQRLAEVFQTGVTHRDRDVAQEAPVSGSADRGVSKYGAEIRFAQPGHTFQRRREFYGMKRGFFRFGGAPVPGTDVLADIATKDVSADGGARASGIEERSSMVK